MNHLCSQCDRNAVDRTELIVRPLLLRRVMHPPSACDNVLFGQTCNVVRRRRPDLIWFATDRVIVCEIDENGGHGTINYTPECDFGWVMDMTTAIVELYRDDHLNGGRIPLITVVRWNPDEYDAYNVPLDTRVDVLASRLNQLLTRDLTGIDTHRPEIEYYYYHSKCTGHIQFASRNPDAARVTVVV